MSARGYDAAMAALHRADSARLSALLRKSPLLVARPEFLASAARASPSCCEVLLDGGADIEAMDGYWGSSALSTATAAGALDCVELLLLRGALVDGPPFGRNPALHSAAKHGRLEIASCLHRAGADLDRDSLDFPHSALNIAEELAVLSNKGQAQVAEYLRSVGATKPWDYNRPDTFWDDTIGQPTILLVEGCLGLTHAKPVGERKTEHATIHIRRARHGWKTNFQTLYSAGLPTQGGHCEVGLCLTSKWPLHRRALEESRFRRPVDFLTAVSDRILQGAPLAHGDLLGREHELVRGLDWPGDFDQWVAVRHESYESRRAELSDSLLPEILLLIPHLGKKPLKTTKEARAIADAKANVKWEKPAASGAKNNLVVPLCYDAPWLSGHWY